MDKPYDTDVLEAFDRRNKDLLMKLTILWEWLCEPSGKESYLCKSFKEMYPPAKDWEELK